jgi:hypothetical protein
MDILQHILVYITLALAIGFIAFKFFIPKSVWGLKKRISKACGQDDCGCH